MLEHLAVFQSEEYRTELNSLRFISQPSIPSGSSANGCVLSHLI